MERSKLQVQRVNGSYGSSLAEFEIKFFLRNIRGLKGTHQGDLIWISDRFCTATTQA